MKEVLTKAKVKAAVCLICLFSLQVLVASAHANVVMSEIMYHPAQLLDDYYEFLELYNTGTSTVNLQNWVIDGIGFTFPAGASIGPGAYLVLAKDANLFQATYGFAPNYVYTGKLSNSGELIKLLDANGISVDEVGYTTYPPWPVTPDELGPSLERINPTLNGNTPRNWHASIAAAKHTAGALNSVNAVGLPPWISNAQHGTVQPGIPITVTASVQDATTVNLKYIINFGTSVIIPMYDDGLSGDGVAGDGVYGTAIPAQSLNTLIRYRIDANGTTGLMGFPRDDDSVVYTGTYIENDASVITGLPIVHWLIDPCDYTNAVATCLTDANYPALVYYNGTLYDGIRIHARGNTSRTWPKKNWKFRTARNHNFFMPGLTGIPVDNFNFQASYSDKSYTRENSSWHLFEDVGEPSCQFFPVRMYQNGQFFGLYSYFEALDKSFLERNGLDADTGATYKASQGSMADCRYFPLAELPAYYEKHRPADDGDFNDLHDLLNGINNLTGQAWRNFIFDNLDIPRVMNYLAAMVVLHDNDAIGKNYYLYRDNAGTKRWYFLPWDKDLTFGRNYNGGGVLNDDIWANVDSISGRTNVSPSHPLFGDQEHQKYDYLWNRLTELLYNETDFRNMFYRRLRTIMDEQLQASGTPYAQRKIEKRVDELTALEDTEAAMDTSKWGSWGQYQTTTQAAQILKDSYLAVRRTHLFVTHRVAGEIPEAQIPGLPIVINEIMYNPAGGDNDEFIELYNPSSTESVDMSGWQLDGVELTFPPGTVLLPQSYLVVAKNDVQFRATYGSGIFIAAQYGGSLDNTGENLVLKDRQSNAIDEVYYDDGGFWPTLSGGKSLELIDVSRNNNHPTNWAASVSAGGTPGVINSMAGTFPYIPELKVNEVLSVNTSINTDEMGEYAPWIEIYNALPNLVDLGGMFLTNDYNNPAKWAIPANTILNSGQWMIFWADAEPNEGPLHTNFALNAAGGSVGLYTAAGKIIDYLDYGPLAANISYGKYPDGVAMYREFATPTPAAQNYIAPVPLILNEYTGVADNKYLKDNASDTYWGRVLGNGGDWFELVVTQDHLDARGWNLIVTDNAISKTLTLTSNNLWADLRAGTIITVSENLPDNVSNYDPPNGKWWINVQAKTGASGTYITAANFDVSQTNSQITIRNSGGTVVFGPSGEGIKPASGIGNDEIFHLEEDPGPLITARSNYTDGSASTFGAPNIYTSGKIQDFSELRNIPDAGAPAPNPMAWTIVPTTTGSTSITMIATAASDPTGVEYYFNNVTDPNHDSGWQNSTYYKDKNLLSNTTYTYRVKARDKSAAQNETAWSGTASEITPLLLSPPVSGTVDANISSSARTSATFSHTVAAGDNRLLVVSVMIRGDKSVSSITYAGNELTRGVVTASGASGGCAVEIWYLVAPSVGTANVVVNFAASVDPSGITAVNFTGVNQNSPIGAITGANATSGTSITMNITTRDVNSLVFGAATAYGGDTDSFTPGSGITEMWDNHTGTSTTSDNGLWGGKRTAVTPGVYTFNTTAAVSDDWAIAAIEIKAAVAISPPGQASNPNPAAGATDVNRTQDLSWTAGSGTTLHGVFFGTTNPPPFIQNQSGTTYDTGTMAAGTTYYWRIDEKNAGGTTTGTVWSFTTVPAPPGQAGNPSPANSARIVSTTADLNWTAGSGAASHDVYFGTSSPPTFQGNQSGTTFDPGTISAGTTFYWRIDEKNAGGTTTGIVWNFTTGVSVPDVVGMTETAARAAIIAANLTVGTVTYQYSDTVAANNVISQNPAGGTAVDTGTNVNMVVSLGKPVVPNVVGMTQAAAAAAITAVDNLTVGTVTTAYSSTVPPGQVISQNPASGTLVNTGSSVNLVISLCAPVVPNVVGMTQAAATAAITAVGSLTVGNITYAYSNTVAAGIVMSQNPVGGIAVGCGSSVDLVISLGKPVVPDIVGMTEAAAAAAITAVDNLTVGNITQQCNDTVAAGLVISQNPVGGTEVNIGSSVDFIVSLGKPLITIMPLGDSITRGHSSTNSNGYRKPLYDKLADANYSFDFVGSQTNGSFPDPNHEGHDGWHADTTGTNDILGQVYNWLTANPADIVLLHIGTNDITVGGQDANEVKAILNEIDRFSTDIKVILALIVDRVPHSPATTQYNLDVNNMAQSRIAAGDDIIVVDMEHALNYPSDLPDGVHPNDVGYAKMANVWFDALDSILPPSIISTPVTNVTVFQQYIYDVNASGCPEPNYALITYPDGMTIDHNTGLIEWWPTVPGDFNVTVRASNGQMPDANQNFVITVSLKPVVPNVVGMTQAAATAVITAVDSLTVGTVTTAYNDTIIAGLVISQNPVGGTEVNTGSFVDLIISLGRPVVPNVVGQTQAAATTAITAVDNLTVGTVTQQCSDTVAAGNVISQNPAGGTQVDTGTAVDLVISSGQPSVPNVTGMPVDQALFILSAAGFPVGVVTTQCSNTVAAGLVISQSAIGTVPCGTSVDLVVSSGQPSVPNVVGQTEAAAIAAINAVADISYGSSTTQYSNTVAVGLVISQSSTGIVSCGTVVDLVISLGKPVVPDVVGMTQAAATTAIAAVDNLTVGTVTQQCSDTVAAGNVISQNPAGNTQVDTGTAVDLVVSSGQPSVPDVTGMTEAAAIAAINAVANISYGSSSIQYSDTVPAGDVINQSATGAVSCGTVVDLVISNGPPPVTIRSNGTGGGDWNTGTTWIGGVAPRAIDDVIIEGNDVVTLISAGSCTNLTMNAGTTLSLDANSVVIPGTSWNLAPTSTVIYNGLTTVDSAPQYGNLVYSSGNGSPNGNLMIMGNLYITANTLRGIAVTSGTYTHNVSGDVIVSGTGRITAVNQKNPTTASCTWNIGGNLTLGSTSNRIQFYESAGPHTGSAVFNINGNLTVGATSYIMLKSTSSTTADYPEGIINLKGNFVNNGTINVNSATSGTSPGLNINFVGTSPQEWSGTGNFSVTAFLVNINISNAAGVTLSSPRDIPVRTVVILTNGKLTTTSTNLLTISEGSLSGGSSASYINGPLARQIAVGPPQSQEFPVGDATKYVPVNLAFGNVSDADIVKVSTTPGIHPQIVTSGLDSSKTLNRYYTVTNMGTFDFDNVTATFNFDPTDVIGGADPTKYVVKKLDTGTWTTPTTANPSATSIQATDMTSFSDFAVGELSEITIFGRVIETDANIPVEGVSINATNGGGSDTTDANGYYQLTVDYGWSGTVTLHKTGYTFDANGKEYSDITTDQHDDYIAILDTFTIWGHVFDSVTHNPLGGVLVVPDNNGGLYTSKYYGGGSDTTDVNGYYEVLVDYNWSGNIVPSKYAYAIESNSMSYTNVTQDIADQNYIGTLLMHKITGYIKNACGIPISGVFLDANNLSTLGISDSNGYYEVWVDDNWSGTITPDKVYYTFEPSNKVYTDILEDKTGQDYVANNIYDLDCDGSIGYGDVLVISEYWLETGPNVPGDIHKDEDNIVNFLDFADFALAW